MKKQPQITEQTRANLRQAFWSLYAERPIERIPVREICERAGYNRATFYLYYHDVYEVLAEVEDLILDGLGSLVEGRLLRGDTLDFSQHMGPILQMAREWRSSSASRRRSARSWTASSCRQMGKGRRSAPSSRSSTSRGFWPRCAPGSRQTTRCPSTSSSRSSSTRCSPADAYPRGD